METYYLDTIIFFFKTQKELDYVAIEDVLLIIDDPEIPDNVKRNMIFDTLRGYGLNELSYRNGRFSFATERSTTEYFYEKVHENTYPIKPIRFKVLNGSCGVNISLN